jgi:GTP-binding protein HflX
MMNYPSQQKNISKVIVECKILDRTHILDIFTKSRETSYARTSRVGTIILTTKAFWNVDALRASKGNGMRGPGKQKLKLTDVLYVIEFPY